MGQPEPSRVPGWVDKLVDSLVRDFTVVSGPAGTALLGYPGNERWMWRSAAEMETTIFEDPHRRIGGPHKKAIISRLRRYAHVQAVNAPFHPNTQGGEVYHDDARHAWFHRGQGGGEVLLTADGENYLASAHKLSNWGATTRLGLSAAGGNWLAVHGTLRDGDVAYPCWPDEPKALLIPCPRGEERNIIMVVGQEHGLDVLATHIMRPRQGGTRPVFSPYKGDQQQSYFALWNEEKGSQVLRVLKLPD
jgi:hypothetical protein